MSTGLRERKKSETRAALASAAVRLGAERGYAHVTVDDIAEAAGVSPRTFFNHFATKEEAFVAHDIERGRALLARLRDEPLDRPVWPLLTRALGEHLDTGTANREAVRAHYALRTDPAVLAHQHLEFAVLEADLVEELSRRTGNRMQARLLAGTAVAAMRAAVTTWIEDDQVRTLRELFDDAVAQLSSAF